MGVNVFIFSHSGILNNIKAMVIFIVANLK